MDADTGLCAGCARTLAEIAGWADYSDDQKRAVLLLAEQRRATARAAMTRQ